MTAEEFVRQTYPNAVAFPMAGISEWVTYYAIFPQRDCQPCDALSSFTMNEGEAWENARRKMFESLVKAFER